jgi:hypothetical protein
MAGSPISARSSGRAARNLDSEDALYRFGDSRKPLGVDDEAAAARLIALLQPAMEELQQLGGDTTLVAECPDKFNDAGYDDFWYAVQIGRTIWEQSHFFKDAPIPVADERSRFATDFGGDAPDSQTQSAHIATARSILKRLQQKGWRHLSAWALASEDDCDSLLCLMHWMGQPWFYRSTPNCGGGDLWTWSADGKFRHVGYCSCRLDQRVGLKNPLEFELVDLTEIGQLPPEARQYFVPEVKNRAAFERLEVMVTDAAEAVRSATPELVSLRSSSGHFPRGFQYSHRMREAKINWRQIEFDVRQGRLHNSHFVKNAKPYPQEAERLAGILMHLERAKWRDTFGTAYGVPLEPEQELSLVVMSNDALLVRDMSAFTVGSEVLTFSGLCRSPAPAWRDFPDIERLPAG